MYTGDGLELVYYGIGFGGTPFESTESVYGYADAVTGTILYLDVNHWGRTTQKYGNDAINDKVRTWTWDSEAYAGAHTSDKALATAMEEARSFREAVGFTPSSLTQSFLRPSCFARRSAS